MKTVNLKKFFQSVKPSNVDFVLDEIVVVGPYPTSDFFRMTIRTFKPKKIWLIVDDGWTPQQIQAIVKTTSKCQTIIHRSSPLEKNGLVHAKLYLFKWRKKVSKTVRYKLLWGSANASLPAFEIHAEVMSQISLNILSDSVYNKLIAYFGSLKEGNSVLKNQDIKLSKGISLFLPSIKIVSKSEQTFFSWIRSGKLCHRYDRDYTFGKLSVTLLKPLPKTTHELVLATHDFVRETKKDVLQIKYGDFLTAASSKKPRWRGQYFVETWFGHWTSAECFQAQKNDILRAKDGSIIIFEAKGREDRALAVDKIAKADIAEKRLWNKEFLAALKKVFKALKGKNLDPKKYLFTHNGDLNIKYYRKIANKKLKSDHQKAKIPSFKDRLSLGYEFPAVPTLGVAFEDFAIDLCESILKLIRSTKVVNKLARAVKEILTKEELDDVYDGEELYELLNKKWTIIGNEVRQFYIKY